MVGSLLGFCVTHHQGLAIIFVGCGDCPNFFALRNSDIACKQILLYWWTFCMYWDLLKVDLFRLQIRSNNHLVSFAAINVSFNPNPGTNFALVFLCVWWCMFVDKGGQGTVKLFIESVGFLGWIMKYFRSKEICFQVIFINFVVLTKGDISISLGYGG